MQYIWSTLYYRSKYLKVLNQDTAIAPPLSPAKDSAPSYYAHHLYKPDTLEAHFPLRQFWGWKPEGDIVSSGARVGEACTAPRIPGLGWRLSWSNSPQG